MNEKSDEEYIDYFIKIKKRHFILTIILIIFTFISLVISSLIMAFTYLYVVFIYLIFPVLYSIFYFIHKHIFWRCPKCRRIIDGMWGLKTESCPVCKLKIGAYEAKNDYERLNRFKIL